MKNSTRTPMISTRLSRLPTWIPLIPLLVSGCNGCKAPGPRELVCKPIAYHEVLNPEQGAGKAPFSIERLGPELKSAQIKHKPYLLTFTGETRVDTAWKHLGHIYDEATVAYSPAEGLARNVKHPDDVYPMRRFVDGGSEHVRFGFQSEVCRKPVKYGNYNDCDLTENELFLVADMTCTWELYDPDKEIE